MFFVEQSREFTLPEKAVLSNRAREVASERKRLGGSSLNANGSIAPPLQTDE
jgi:hypothetical protein